MTDSYPTMAPGQDSTFPEGVLRGLRRVPWEPEHDCLFPWPSRRRMLFLAWVGTVLGLQPAWTRRILPYVGWADALPSPPRGTAIAEGSRDFPVSPVPFLGSSSSSREASPSPL